MVCYQCGFETEREAGRCPSCGGFLKTEDEKRHLAEWKKEMENERRVNEAFGLYEYQKPFAW
jgi:predicted ATP-dependent serine protease